MNTKSSTAQIKPSVKLLNISLMIDQFEPSGFQQAMLNVLGSANYRELHVRSENLYGNAIRLFLEFCPQIVFIQAQADRLIDRRLVSFFRRFGAFVINWTGDKRAEIPPWMLRLAPHVDCTAFSNFEDVKTLRRLGLNSDYLDIGYDSRIFNASGQLKQAAEIVFMGNNFGDSVFPLSGLRSKMVDFLYETYGNRFAAFGNGWSRSSGDLNDQPYVEAAVYRGAKIAINLSHFDCPGYNSDRLWRILGSGTMCISYRHLEMVTSCRENEHVAYFQNLEELKTQIDFFLLHETQRQEIASQGNLLAQHQHTFEHMVNQIIQIGASGKQCESDATQESGTPSSKR